MATNEGQAALIEHRDEIIRLKTALDVAFGPGVRNNISAPEDFVVFSLGLSSRDLWEEILFLINHGYEHAALRTSRTLYECVVFSLFISKHPETRQTYLDAMHSQWATILRNVPSADQSMPEMHNALVKKVPSYGAGKHISLFWNDEGTTYKMACDVGVSELFHSLAFNYTSGFVHPSAVFLLRRMKKLPNGEFIHESDATYQDWKMALRITHDLMINAIRLRLKYAKSDALRDALELCEKDFSNVWGYVPQLLNQSQEKKA
jgi:hypothetical protein